MAKNKIKVSVKINKPWWFNITCICSRFTPARFLVWTLSLVKIKVGGGDFERINMEKAMAGIRNAASIGQTVKDDINSGNKNG